MKKAIITLLIFSLIAAPVFANPVGSYSGPSIPVIIGILSVFTLGIVYVIYDVFTNHDRVEFTSEEINLTINTDNSVDVEGVYHFRRTGRSISTYEIYYPFPDQKKYGEIEVNSLKINNKDIRYYDWEFAHHDRIILNLAFDDSDKCEMLISFTQFPQNSSYKYILRSTRKWKKELERSEINVFLQDSYELNSNYQELVVAKTDDLEYNMVMNQFYPEKDLIINWEKR
jgi:hypothetical protein